MIVITDNVRCNIVLNMIKIWTVCRVWYFISECLFKSQVSKFIKSTNNYNKDKSLKSYKALPDIPDKGVSQWLIRHKFLL